MDSEGEDVRVEWRSVLLYRPVTRGTKLAYACRQAPIPRGSCWSVCGVRQRRLEIVADNFGIRSRLSDKSPSNLPFMHPVRGNRPGKPVQLQEYEIKYLCTKAREIFINQPILLELEAPIKICGT